MGRKKLLEMGWGQVKKNQKAQAQGPVCGQAAET